MSPQQKNKVEKSIKRKQNMVIKSIRWIVMGMIIGFLLTLVISCVEAYKVGLMNTLNTLMTHYFNLILEITHRNPRLANWILEFFGQGSISNLNDINGFLSLAAWSFKLDVVKFISVFCSFSVFIFAGFLGLLDGLLTRYIRTAEGGRESTYIYHHLADALFKIPFCLVVAYLALPFPLKNPLILVVILAMISFLFCRLSASNLKKFI